MSHSNKGKHLNFEQRKIIANQLGKKDVNCQEIANILEVDASTVSKEIKRNREVTLNAHPSTKKVCKKLDRFPHVCNRCSTYYSGRCPFTQYAYKAYNAQCQADSRLVHSRRGINLTQEEFQQLDRLVTQGVKNNQSIYHLVKNNPDIPVTEASVYRYIRNNYLTSKKIDLTYVR